MVEPPRIDAAASGRPDLYDPDTQPELFEGVLSRRIFAFLIDITIVLGPMILLSIFIAMFGLVTLGFGWVLFGLLPPIFAIWAIVYTGSTLGSPASATLGMRALDLEMRTWYGGPMYFVLGAVHVIFFWVSVSVLTPLVLLVALFNRRRRLLHDFLTGTIVMNNPARAASLRRAVRR